MPETPMAPKKALSIPPGAATKAAPVKAEASKKATAVEATAKKKAAPGKATPPEKAPPPKKPVAKKPVAKKPVVKKATEPGRPAERKKVPPAKAPAEKASAATAAIAKTPTGKTAAAKAPAPKAPAAKKPATAKAPTPIPGKPPQPGAEAKKKVAPKTTRSTGALQPETSAVSETPPEVALPISEIELEPGYEPSPHEEYMNPQQLAYFRRKLLEWRDSLLRESQQTIDHLRSDGASRYVGDEADRARDESEVALELRTRDRYRKLLPKIEAALRRIDDGSYGFCEETGEPIGLKRLEARPIAMLSVEAQELREKSQRGYRDDG